MDQCLASASGPDEVGFFSLFTFHFSPSCSFTFFFCCEVLRNLSAAIIEGDEHVQTLSLSLFVSLRVVFISLSSFCHLFQMCPDTSHLPSFFFLSRFDSFMSLFKKMVCSPLLPWKSWPKEKGKTKKQTLIIYEGVPVFLSNYVLGSQKIQPPCSDAV